MWVSPSCKALSLDDFGVIVKALQVIYALNQTFFFWFLFFQIVLILSELTRHILSKWPFEEFKLAAISVLCYFFIYYLSIQK